MADIAGPCREVVRYHPLLSRVVPAPPPLETLMLLHGQEIEASLLVYTQEALEFLPEHRTGCWTASPSPNPIFKQVTNL